MVVIHPKTRVVVDKGPRAWSAAGLGAPAGGRGTYSGNDSAKSHSVGKPVARCGSLGMNAGSSCPLGHRCYVSELYALGRSHTNENPFRGKLFHLDAMLQLSSYDNTVPFSETFGLAQSEQLKGLNNLMWHQRRGETSTWH